jgi:hypothetical protein
VGVASALSWQRNQLTALLQKSLTWNRGQELWECDNNDSGGVFITLTNFGSQVDSPSDQTVLDGWFMIYYSGD